MEWGNLFRLLSIWQITSFLIHHTENSDHVQLAGNYKQPCPTPDFSIKTELNISSSVCTYFWIRHVRNRPNSIPVKPRSKSQKLILLILGGIEQNPGPEPSLKFPCGVCACEVEDSGTRAICCNNCDKWIHKSCVGMLTSVYDELEANSAAPWFCPDCGTPHHSHILYDAPDSVGSVYSEVSEGEPSTPDLSTGTHSFSLSDTSVNSFGSPEATSSPKASPKNNKQRKNLRFLNINFQSVRNKGRNIDALIETTKPDIILGTETWLSSDIQSSYFFNPELGFNVYRRDRPTDPHGGVLIAVKSDIEVLDIECKNVWSSRKQHAQDTQPSK